MHVELVRMQPGEAPREPERLTGDALPRRSVVLAPRGSQLAVGWLEQAGGEWTLVVRTLPDGPSGRYGPVAADSDYDDVQLAWESGILYAAVRRNFGGGELLSNVQLGTDMASFRGDIASAADFGELRRAKTSGAAVVLSGTTRELWRLTGGSWNRMTALSGFVYTAEGDLVELSGGSFLGVLTDNPGTGRPLRLVELRATDDGLEQDGSPRDLGWHGPDPVVDAVGDGLVLAWCDETDGMRPLGLAMLADDGSVVVDRCAVPSERPVANDPDLACGGGWCAAVWLEADDYNAPDFVTRVIQVPAVTDRDRFCPM